MEEQENTENINMIKETIFGLPNSVILKIIHNNPNLKNYKVRKEAVTTLGRCLSMFILYITDGALEHCEGDKRSTISVHDILKSLDDSLFLDIHDELKRQVAIQEEIQKKEKAAKDANNTAKADTGSGDDKAQGEMNQANEQDDLDILLQALE
ncbi:CCAAT-binding transcription factor, putative [Plasmodium knowlesi strain H]|uniref:CCAAT-binding transcription factor, putative n=3 Tax=Plasmodium knowlesi TaxID=5850 RepID=A0A5K1U2X2_PLAKH|nr:CCAAT-binding transcription factor, putative [Plasmodium knowlesi strain H]OTN63866.1 putative CCAAT-binding transcription factor [Plasmodium knowlesi]CAA9990684.1 CCAAT-binding transcription factor, putative [Plasmodium knowlesi strain H]SBO25927.1 CCAAT-binding transcription factor, putative [Plasmodium knowlesi strain H]SBO28674.1 CCAAT-binding transcription factor, putative [Plasmodium knowlesi strain H]VVS80158.1 CCAAT-binding transcription factor, putative [Plasmodium knowlesi strain |eukprot:XP_002261974.1 CCAAT-binding transcription factor, putative [Plasmodium knowlesi strain H]